MNGEPTKKSNRRIRVLLVSNYQIVRESLKILIESNADLAVTGSHSFEENIGRSGNIRNSDVAVVDYSTGDRIEIIVDLLRKHPELRVVVMIAGLDLDAQASALKLGAVGIVQKEQSSKFLIEAIRQTYSGETWLNQVLLSKILERSKSSEKRSERFVPGSQSDSLTARELEVIKLIGEGLKNKSIAEKLSITEATVRHHLSSIYGKIGVADRLNLVILAFQTGLLAPSGVLGEKLPEFSFRTDD